MKFSQPNRLLKQDRLGATKSHRSQRLYTLFLVTSRGKSRTFGFSHLFAKILACLAVAAVLGVSHLLFSYKAAQDELSELRYMRDVAEHQKEQINTLQKQYEELTVRLREAEIMEAQIRDMLSQEDIIPQSFGGEASVASLGGRNRSPLVSRDGAQSRPQLPTREMGSVLQTVSSSTDELTNRLDQVNDQVAELLKEAVSAVAYSRACPKYWPVIGKITSSFGTRLHPVTGRKQIHDGVDIGASYGERILAPADGVVTFAGYKAGYGYCVVVKHGFGFETLYGHCSSMAVKVGSTISRGDLVGKVGQSGVATGPHLHYEIHVNGKIVDPRGFLP